MSFRRLPDRLQVYILVSLFWALYNLFHLSWSFLHAPSLKMTCFPTVLAFSTGSWASIINTMFIPTPETAIEFQFEPGLVCRCYLVPRVILPSICADAICSVKAVDVSGFFFLLTECLLASWPACAIACICAFVLSFVLARS